MPSQIVTKGTRASVIALTLLTATVAWAQDRVHPLIGKIYSTEAAKLVNETALTRAVSEADFVLLGEIHSNAEHHALQAKYVGVAAQAGSKPDVVFEMLSPHIDPVLARWWQDNPGKTDGLGTALTWKKRGWGSFADYEPIFRTALTHGLSVRGGNLKKKRVREIAFKGNKALSDKERQELFVDRKLSDKQNDFLLDLLFESHCKLMPRQALSGMALAQRVRDGSMARAMLAAKSSAVLIAGAGHARYDIGVPRLLRAERPDAKIVSVAFIEVEPKAIKPRQYLPPSPDSKPVFDFLFFTAKSSNADHCAALKKRFQKRVKKPKSD